MVRTGNKRGGRRHQLRRGNAGPSRIAAAIDLGTNNCRLLVASLGPSGGLSVVDSFSRIVRLGEGLVDTGELSPAALDRTVAALKVCGDRMRKSGATHVRAIATHASRDARNASVLVERAATEAGLRLEIVSAEEEARLAAVGCAPLIADRAAGALVFDIGGGSTEIIWMHRDDGAVHTRHAVSVPAGVVTIAERRGNGQGDRTFFESVRETVRNLFAPARAAMNGFDMNSQHLLGTSGTVTTLAGISLGLDRYVRARVDASWHDCADILKVVNRVVDLDRNGRAALGCVGMDRVDLMLPGCAIFTAIHDLWPCEQLRVADRGLREGILRELLAKPA